MKMILKNLAFFVFMSCVLCGMEPQEPARAEQQATGLPNIKNTLGVLNSSYERFSLVHGAIAWETGLIRRLYDFGCIFPRYEEKKGRMIVVRYDRPEQMHKVVRLIHAFFYRVPESIGETDFGVTIQLNNNDPQYIAGLMAQIIAGWDQLQKYYVQFNDALNSVEKILADLGKKFLQGKVGFKLLGKFDKNIKDLRAIPWKKENKDAFISTCNEMFERLESKLGDRNKKAIEDFSATFSDLIKNIEKLLNQKIVFKTGENVGRILYGALGECDQGSSALYPQDTVHMIMLAFVYAKCGQSRSLFKIFYDALDKQLDGKLINPAWLAHSMIGLKDEWIQDSFGPVNQYAALMKLDDIFKLSGQDIIRNMDAVLYYSQQIRSLPSPINYTDTIYEYAPGKKTKTFPNCMCNTIRNFINVLAFDTDNNLFDLTVLTEKLQKEGIKFNPLLEVFYKQHSGVNEASSIIAHNDWIKVISNIPYAAYTKSTGTVDANGVPIDAAKWGYIAIPEKEKNNKTLLLFLENKGFQILPDNHFGYELKPSVRNIIVVLDYLLGLNLFEGKLADEFVTDKFIKNNLARLCKALQAKKCFQSTDRRDSKGKKNVDFDDVDFSLIKIFSTFVFQALGRAKFSYEIMTKNGIHGEPYLRGGQSKEEDALCKLFKFKTCTLDNTSFRFVQTNILCKYKIDFSCSGTYRHNPGYLTLFSIPLENTDLFKAFMKNLDKSITQVTQGSLSYGQKASLINLLLRLACEQPTNEDRSIAMQPIFKKWGSSENVKIFMDYASNAVTSQYIYVLCSGIEVLQKVVEWGYSEVHEMALKIALNTLKSDNENVQAEGAWLFLELLQKGYKKALDGAFKAASMVTKSRDENALWAGIEIFKILVSNNYPDVNSMAMIAALKSVKSDDNNVRLVGSNLLKMLIVQDSESFCYPTLKVVSELLNSLNNQKFDLGHDILRTLIDQDCQEAVDPAIKAAWSAVTSQEGYIKVIGLTTFTALVDRGIISAFDSAIQAAGEVLKYSLKHKKYSEIHDAAVHLFETLLQAASYAVSSDETDHQLIGVDLLEKLKDAYPEETKKTIQELLESEDVEEAVKEDLRKI